MGARHCILKGRVQGVGFRYFTLRKAEELGIKGWVRNLPNGNVEVQCEGEDMPLKQFLACLREGPRLAAVDEVQVREIDRCDYDCFSIER